MQRLRITDKIVDLMKELYTNTASIGSHGWVGVKLRLHGLKLETDE